MVRLIPYQEYTGAQNMAIDAWLWQVWAPHHQQTVLRFYGWSAPTVSLGFHQNPLPGVTYPQIQRPTGGRAVLHGGDVCYAIAAPVGGWSRQDSYRYFCRFLTVGLAHWGLSVGFGAERVRLTSPNCFAGQSPADLQIDGHKLIGSAQAWRHRHGQNWVLQHGSMQRRPDRPAWQKLFGQAPAGLDTWLEPVPTAAEIAQGLAQAATTTYGWVLEEQPLTEAEWSEIAQWEAPWPKTSSKY